MSAPTTADPGLVAVRERGWRLGLANLMRAGFGSWFGTRTWLVQVLIWVAVTNGTLMALLQSGSDPGSAPPLTVYTIMSMFAAIAVSIVMMDEVVGERKNGTAAWVLSKPVSRPAFIVSKLVPNALGVLVTMVLVPGALAFVQVTAWSTGVEPLPFLAGLAVIWLALLFYLTLTLMLGTLLDHAGAVVGIALAILFGQQMILSTPIAPFLPWSLTAPIGQSPVSNSSALMLGQALPAPGAIVVVAVACVVFVAVAIRQFQRAEL